jgi:hypothetical protein
MPRLHHIQLFPDISARIHSTSASAAPLIPTSSPLVLICGWTGGKQQTISKAYVSRYAALGFHVLVVTAAIPLLMGKEATEHYGRLVASNAWKLLVDGTRPVITHVLSNGGARNLWTLLKLDPGRLQGSIVAQIWDSTPIVSSVRSHAEFILSTTLPKGGSDPKTRTWSKVLCAYATAVPWLVGYESWHVWWKAKKAIGMDVGPEGETPHAIAVSSLFRGINYPRLKGVRFLYSTTDRLTDYRGVEAARDAMRTKFPNVKISGKLWTDTEHVAHAQGHPMEYWSEVAGVLADVGLEGGEKLMAQVAGNARL